MLENILGTEIFEILVRAAELAPEVVRQYAASHLVYFIASAFVFMVPVYYFIALLKKSVGAFTSHGDNVAEKVYA
jgi:hypothetical protein